MVEMKMERRSSFDEGLPKPPPLKGLVVECEVRYLRSGCQEILIIINFRHMQPGTDRSVNTILVQLQAPTLKVQPGECS